MAVSVDPARKMDRMYRYTRHVYDLSRRYYLLGRDRMLRQILLDDPAHVLEVGCGTARNLVWLHRRAPHVRLYGLDASQAMLDTADAALRRAGVRPHVALAQGLAQDLRPADRFPLDGAALDTIYFSYTLSMIPVWEAALEAALAALPVGGRLYVVDFWDQGDLPGWFASLLTRWLALFDVHHRPALLARLRALDAGEGRTTTTVTSVARRYAYVARLVKR